MALQLDKITKSFNSQPHKGADGGMRSDRSRRRVSTHSPTRGLTAVYGLPVMQMGVSTHSPTRGLTRRAFYRGSAGRFNSQPHKGADHILMVGAIY